MSKDSKRSAAAAKTPTDTMKICMGDMGASHASTCAYATMIGFSGAGAIDTKHKACPSNTWYMPSTNACYVTPDKDGQGLIPDMDGVCPKGFNDLDGYCGVDLNANAKPK